MKNPDSNRASGMQRWLPTIAALAVLTLTASLGNWQLRRADEKRGLQARMDAAASQAPAQVAAVPIDAASLDGLKVRVRGEWVPEYTVFIDNRTHKGVAGFHVATPVRIEGSSMHLLVLRGWIARNPSDRTALPSVPVQPGVIEVSGLGMARIEKVLELKESPPPGPGERLWQNLDFERFATWSGLTLQPLLLRQVAAVDATDTLIREWPRAGSDVDKHLGYAFQWFGMALATLSLWGYFAIIRRRKETTHD
jgi:surfeit locus 1 family protein